MENGKKTKQLSPKQIEKALDILLKDIVKDTDIFNIQNAEKSTKLLTEKIQNLNLNI